MFGLAGGSRRREEVGEYVRGSLWVLFGASMLYTLVALGIGLLISSAVKSQLVASQLTLLATFMPAFMLSGFLFDLRSMPAAVRRTGPKAGEIDQ